MTEKNVKSKTKLIAEIARETGISLATVYRAATAPHTVSEETRRRVLKVMEERNISIARRPRQTRRARPEARPGRMVFLVPHSPYRTAETISEEMVHGIQEVFTAQGIEWVLHHYAWKEGAAAELPHGLGDNAVAGILIRPSSNRSLLLEFCRGRKAVLLGNSFPDLALPCVTVDDYEGMRLSLEYLFELGHRRIAFASLAPSMLIYRRRLDAYVAILYQHGVTADPRLIKLHEGWATTLEDTRVLCKRYINELLSLEAPPTAIAATTDSFAANLILAAREAGARVPQELSITGFGDQYFAALTDPPITTVHVDQRAIGETGARLLMQLIEGAPGSVQALIRPTLVERRSCAVCHQQS